MPVSTTLVLTNRWADTHLLKSFFGRKENSNIESLDITKSQDTSTESDDNDFKQWQENVSKIREESTMAQVKASTSMVE